MIADGAETGPGGLFITVEGPEGGGKSTQVAHLAERLQVLGHRPLVLREPGGTAAGEAIRSILLDPGAGSLRPATEALLFAAARSELTGRLIRPALRTGQLVLCDRFADSSRAYQGYGRGLDRAQVETLIALATAGLAPDLTLLLDLPVPLGLERRRLQGDWNRLDGAERAFHERVRAGFLSLARTEPARWRVVDASGSEQAVAEAVWVAVGPHVAAWAARAGQTPTLARE